MMRMVHELPGTTFSSTADRGSYASGTHAALTLGELQRWLALGSVNVVVSSDSAEGTSSAANAPWQARAVISIAKLTDPPPIAETTAEPARPSRKAALPPSRSAGLPA